MKIYNSLTKSVDDFTPLDGEMARIYSCGPTVYNNAHIGNLSSFVYADMLRRAVNLAGFPTKQVMNLTDVDDKTVLESAKRFSNLDPKGALKKLTTFYEEIFKNDMTKIGNQVSEISFIHATDSINDIQSLIHRLLSDGIAYVSDDGVYFDIKRYQKKRKYGQLSNVGLASNTIARINNDEYDKESAQDFALWKRQRGDEPGWDFEVNGHNLLGRPGWHIECSAMSVKALGQPFDIHTGAVDLIFPHHENEIAQSTAGNQPETYAKFFVHNEHLLVDNAKMSKSKNNFYTLSDIIEKGFDPLDFRMLILQSHYRSPSNFSWDNLTAARNRLRSWKNTAELRWQVPDIDDDGQFEIMNNLRQQAGEALMNDMNTPEALKFIDEAIKVITQDLSNVNHFALTALFDFVDLYLGIDVLGNTPDLTDEQKDLINERQVARSNDDYETADNIRDNLLEQNIELSDSPIGPIWSRK